MRPTEINTEWTEELLHLMVQARNKRFDRARGVKATTPRKHQTFDGLMQKMTGFGSQMLKVTKR